MTERHHVVASDDIPEGGRVVVDIDGKEIGVFNVDGEFYAVANYCTHQGGPLCEGRLGGTMSVDDEYELQWERQGRILSCPWHGWGFDVTTGEHVARSGYRIPVYDVVEEEGQVYVEF
jgi:nitrite reductase/ring-hydroxylating ferredoxin subunit